MMFMTVTILLSGVTELTMRHQNEYCQSLEEKISVLEAQRQNLLEINEQQAVKLDSLLKQMQQQRNPLNVTDSRFTSVKSLNLK